MSWYNKEITVADANQLFDELQAFTYETIVNYARELLDIWPPSVHIPTRDFTPKGVVVNISRTPSMWNALHLLTRHVYGTHFLVMSGRHSSNAMHSYPMLRELPSMVLMPFSQDDLIQHAGYISQHTFGIELRSVGRLRPYLGELPPPILPIEESEDVFNWEGDEEPSLYTSFNMWREPFEGPTYMHRNNYHELPTRSQILTMVVLMKVLNAYTEGAFEKQLIIPANCIRNIQPILPGIPWDLIRRHVVDNYKIVSNGGNEDWISNIFINHSCLFEDEDIEFENDGTLAGQLDYARWRGEVDDGQLLSLFDTEREYSLARGYKRALAEAGYHVETPEDCNFAMQLYAISRNIGESRESDVYTKLQQDIYF